MPTVRITIDDRAIRAATGQTILKAAENAGIDIPRLCAYKDLTPHGSCRVCSVRANGQIVAACVQPVAEGMVVENDTPEMNDYRRAIVDMLFVEGNHLCMACEKTGHCELQGLAYRLGIAAPRYPLLHRHRDLDMSHPDVWLDRNRCILCGRCVRVSAEIDGKHVFQFVGRGQNKRLEVDGHELGATALDGTDAAVAACPTGALGRKRVGFTVPIGERPLDRGADAPGGQP